MGVAKPMRDRAPVEILAVGSREGRKQARAFWDDRRTIRSGITVSENKAEPPASYWLGYASAWLFNEYDEDR
jgi:hypothetical protein